MKKKLTTILLVGLFSVVCSALAAYYTKSNLDNAHDLSLANSNLYDLSYVIDALNELKKPDVQNAVIQNKLETILITSLITIRAINPDINELQGTPTETLCQVIKYSRMFGISNEGIGKYNDKELSKLATTYLQNVEPALKNKAECSVIPLHKCNELFGINKKYKILK